MECIDLHIRHHLGLGFQKIYLLDFNSEDGSREVLESWESHPRVETFFTNEDIADHRPLHEASRQRVYEDPTLTHVLHVDADEFVVLPEGLSISEMIETCPSDAYFIRRRNMVPTPLLKDGLKSDVVQQLGRGYFYTPQSPEPEVAPISGLQLDDGVLTHPSDEGMLNSLSTWLQQRPMPKVMHRTVEVQVHHAGHVVSGTEIQTAVIPGNICLAHIPLSSFERFHVKVQNVQRCLPINPVLQRENVALHWKHWDRALRSGRLEEVYARAVLDIETTKSLIRQRRIMPFHVLLEQRPCHIGDLFPVDEASACHLVPRTHESYKASG